MNALLHYSAVVCVCGGVLSICFRCKVKGISKPYFLFFKLQRDQPAHDIQSSVTGQNNNLILHF